MEDQDKNKKGLDINLSDISRKDLKNLGIPAGLILGLAALSFFAYTTLSGRVTTLRDSLQSSRRAESVLQEKQQILSEVSGQIGAFVNSSTVSVPDKNASLMMISQLKFLANQRLVDLKNLNIGSSVVQNGMSKVQLQFDVDGDLAQVSSFITELSQVAPVSTVDKITVTQVGGVVRASISLSVYSAPFPTELPPITEPINDLTQNERDILQTLSSLTAPPLTQVSPQSPSSRANPFE